MFVRPRPFAVLALFAALLAPLALRAQPLPPLVTPTELAARLADPALRVVDVRPRDAEVTAPSYARDHISGALSAPYGQWRGPKDNPGALPPTDKLTALIRSLGIDAATPVVVVYEGADATEFGAAARVFWTLKAAGLTQLSILNGGMTAWRAAGLPVTTVVARATPSSYTVQWNPRVIATQADVAQAAGRALLLDARPSAYFWGQTKHAAAKTPGTLVGAKNVAHAVWFEGDGAALASPDDIRRVAAAQGVDASQPTVSFCNTGHWAATNWFVLSEVLGQPDVKLYPESMVGWSAAGLPMDHVPTRLAQFWNQLKEAAGLL
jgi:thiosulfate/3-mercaptopyruvate sulfurtransferase